MRCSDCHQQSGFTLAELIVASTLMSIVLMGVYSTFHSTILHWRTGSANEATYSDARRIFTLLKYDLGGVPNDVVGLDAREYFVGDNRQFEFVTVIQPMNLGEKTVVRPMKVSYRLSGEELMRVEEPIEGPLAIPIGLGQDRGAQALDLGPRFERTIGTDILGFRATYLWEPVPEHDENSRPMWVDLIEMNVAEARLPNAVSVELWLRDPAGEAEDSWALFRNTFFIDGVVSFPPFVDGSGEVYDNAV